MYIDFEGILKSNLKSKSIILARKFYLTFFFSKVHFETIKYSFLNHKSLIFKL